MIDRIEGEVLEVGSAYALVQIGGIGVRVQIPRLSAGRLDGKSRAALWTRLLVREGDPQLYGFDTRAERDCFDALLAVNGVGPRIALAILSHVEPYDLRAALEAGSTNVFDRVPGVGKKLAGRILLELKGRLPFEVNVPAGPRPASEGIAVDAVRALTSLGYALPDAQEAVRRALAESPSPPPPLDALLRSALSSLNRARS